jgi:ABC-2 type transport system permease protein
MHNILLIARREYLERVRAKSFVLMTILIPLLMGGLLYGAAIINGRSSSNAHIAIVTQEAQFCQDMQSELKSEDRGTMSAEVLQPTPTLRAELESRLDHRKLDGYLWITPPTQPGGVSRYEWVPKSLADIITKANIASAIRAVRTRERLSQSGMAQAEVNQVMKPVDLEISKSARGGSLGAFASAYALFFLMYFVILFYGMNVARSIIEEKTSRVFEVMLATIRPREMMAGKVIGVGSVGLTQVGIWIVAAAVLAQFGAMGAGIRFPLTAVQVVFFIVFFVLGYLLYSSIAAALGAMTSSEQELQQLNMFLMLPLIACSVVIFRVVTDSDGLLAQVFSFIPFCTPLIMYVRIAVHQPPAWQIALSVFDLVLTIAITLWLASRIYRVGILMYGKKPNLPEIVRWLRYT